MATIRYILNPVKQNQQIPKSPAQVRLSAVRGDPARICVS